MHDDQTDSLGYCRIPKPKIPFIQRVIRIFAFWLLKISKASSMLLHNPTIKKSISVYYNE